MVLKELSLLMIKRGNKLCESTIPVVLLHLGIHRKSLTTAKEPRGWDLYIIDQAKIFCRGW